MVAAVPKACRASETVRSMTLERAVHIPASVKAMNSDCVAMSATPAPAEGLGEPSPDQERCSAPAASEPAPMPTRITVRRSEKTARNAPSMMEKWRNQMISIPRPAKPDNASAMATGATTLLAGIRDPGSGIRFPGFFGAWDLGFGIWDLL